MNSKQVIAQKNKQKSLPMLHNDSEWKPTNLKQIIFVHLISVNYAAQFDHNSRKIGKHHLIEVCIYFYKLAYVPESVLALATYINQRYHYDHPPNIV